MLYYPFSLKLKLYDINDHLILSQKVDRLNLEAIRKEAEKYTEKVAGGIDAETFDNLPLDTITLKQIGEINQEEYDNWLFATSTELVAVQSAKNYQSRQYSNQYYRKIFEFRSKIITEQLKQQKLSELRIQRGQARVDHYQKIVDDSAKLAAKAKTIELLVKEMAEGSNSFAETLNNEYLEKIETASMKILKELKPIITQDK